MSWPKGTSGSPAYGRAVSIPEDLRKKVIKEREKTIETICNLMQMKISEIDKLIKGSDLTGLEASLAKVLIDVINDGDPRKLMFLFSYSIGKPMEHIEITNPDGSLQVNHAAIFEALEEYRRKNSQLGLEDQSEEG